MRGRLFVDETVIPPAPVEKRKCNYRFNIHAFIRTQDHMLPFGGITIETTPTKASKLVLRRTSRTENNTGVPAGLVTGLLKGDWPDNQQVDAVVVSDSDGVTYSGSGFTNSSGTFSIVVGGVPAGSGKLMLYYFGPNLAPSTLGPLAVKF